jgi:hypothetical protein
VPPELLEILFYDEAPGRQLGLAILGESGLGKSYILKHFSDNLHPQFRTRDRGMPVRPVVYLELPAEFKLSDLQEQVLAALGATANGWRGSKPGPSHQAPGQGSVCQDVHLR